MNTFIFWTTLILFVLFSSPILTPTSIYIFKVSRKNEAFETEKRMHFLINIVIYNILLALAVLACILHYFIYDTCLLHILGYFAYFLVILKFLFFVFNNILFEKALKELEKYFFEEELIIPSKIKIIDAALAILICIIYIFIGIGAEKTYDKIKYAQNTEISNSITSYAYDNNYIIFSKEFSKFNCENNDDDILFNSNETHYLYIKKNDKVSTVLLYDIENPSNSFENSYDKLLELNEKILEKKYSNILDNLYKGINYAPVCYLIKENDILSVYGLIKKDENTKEFYVSNYVIFDMTTGKFSDFEIK